MVERGVLDTSIVVDLLRGFEPARIWLEGLGRSRLAITPVVWMETVQGAVDSVKRTEAIRFLRRFQVEHPTESDNLWAMRQLARFHLSHGIQLEDVLIASVAARLGMPIFTTNLKHFRPLPGTDAIRPY